MINKKKKAVGNMDTVIGTETTVEGKLNSEASLRIEGKVLGEIASEGDVTIGEKGQVECNVQARNVTIAGMIKGNIYAGGKIHIHETGKLIGNAEMSSIVIDEGGILQGETSMKGKTEGLKETKPQAHQEENINQEGVNREVVNQ